MRAGSGAAQPPLSQESASVLKHSLGLARRRGHAQVTPLHVAATLLSSTASLLRAACHKSQPPSHPLQCRALELCFNVALNRLPAAPAPLHRHPQLPSISNALIAALKRAQAHQRRGCIEHQPPPPPQPIVAIKVELEQLILSILDDPSVSRVMKEAGFSSTSVKNTLENSNSSINSVFNRYNPSGGTAYSSPNFPPITNFFWNPQIPQNPNFPSFNEEIQLIFNVLLNKGRNIVILGDSTSMAEHLVSDMTTKIVTGAVPDDMKSAKLIRFQVSSLPLRFMNKHEVDTNIADLKRKVESYGRAIIYIGDLQWAIDKNDNGGFSDHLIAEIGKLIYLCNSSSRIRVWLMAAANYETYTKWKMRKAWVDGQWDLEAVCVPCGGLGLSLNAASSLDSRIFLSQISNKKLLLFPKEEQEQQEEDVLTCCPDCISSYHKENGNSPQFPFWLKRHPHKNELLQLRRKHNKLCKSLHQENKNMSFGHPDEEVKTTLALGTHGRIEVNRDIAYVLKENIPWQSETIPLIVDALMDGSDHLRVLEDKFVLIQGNDVVGKRRLAVGIAKAVFGSSDLLFHLNMRSNFNTVTENCKMLEKAMQSLEKIVVLVEDIDWADPEFVKYLADILEGRSRRRHGGRSIFVLTTDSSETWCNKDVRTVIQMKLAVYESTTSDIVLKRKAQWDTPTMGKRLRISEMEEVSSDEQKAGYMRRPLLCTTNNILDLNIRADEGEDESSDLSPVSSDLTRETMLTEQHSTTMKFLEKIKTRFVLNANQEQHEQEKRMVLSKLERVFQEKSRFLNVGSFEVEERVLDKVVRGSGMYVKGVLEEWIKEVFGRSLGVVFERGKVSVRVCLAEGCGKDGFRGTSLPKRIPVCFVG